MWWVEQKAKQMKSRICRGKIDTDDEEWKNKCNDKYKRGMNDQLHISNNKNIITNFKSKKNGEK